MSNKAKKEYLAEIKKIYHNATKKEKKLILDQFCSICGYNRKYAIRVINSKEDDNRVNKRAGRKKKYHNRQIFEFYLEFVISGLSGLKKYRIISPRIRIAFRLICGASG